MGKQQLPCGDCWPDHKCDYCYSKELEQELNAVEAERDRAHETLRMSLNRFALLRWRHWMPTWGEEVRERHPELFGGDDG